MRFGRAAALAAALALASCASRPAAISTPAVPASALAMGVRLAVVPAIDPLVASRALAAFRTSCPKLQVRRDASGLTRPDDWRGACAEAERLGDPGPLGATRFFSQYFQWVQVGDGAAFATGYYEPEIAGCRSPRPGCSTPIYAMPPDLTRGTFSDGSGEGRGRFNEKGEFTLYHDRQAIETGALAGRGLEIAYAADPVDLFFLHIQGSGRVRMDDGSVLRIGYAGQNGREYIAIGRLLRERGELPSGGISMASIKSWLRADPARGAALMRENKSYIFFRIIDGAGPLGALDVPVTPRGTVAADPAFVPLGAPVYLDLADDVADGLWIAQDTGGAIKGANRFDTFWGAGDDAARIAGGMSSRGKAFLLLPKSAASVAQAQR